MAQSSFIILKRNKTRMIVRDGYQVKLLKLAMEEPQSLMDRNDLEIIRNGSRSLIVSLPLSKSKNNKKAVLKYYKYRGFLKGLVDMFRASKAMRAWRMGNRLLELGINTPVPLAIGEQRTLQWLRKSFLITREVPRFTALDHYLTICNMPSSKEKIERKKAFIKSLAENIREMHDKGLAHSDPKADDNILVQKDRNRGVAFYFVDLDGCVLRRKLSRYQRIRDLTNLVDLDGYALKRKLSHYPEIKALTNLNVPVFDLVTKTDRLRFFKEYSKGNESIDCRKYLKRIEGRLRKKK
jgi:tRNA A-37 threonylcarbamoyl transferase component Bud32